MPRAAPVTTATLPVQRPLAVGRPIGLAPTTDPHDLAVDVRRATGEEEARRVERDRRRRRRGCTTVLAVAPARSSLADRPAPCPSSALLGGRCLGLVERLAARGPRAARGRSGRAASAPAPGRRAGRSRSATVRAPLTSRTTAASRRVGGTVGDTSTGRRSAPRRPARRTARATCRRPTSAGPVEQRVAGRVAAQRGRAGAARAAPTSALPTAGADERGVPVGVRGGHVGTPRGSRRRPGRPRRRCEIRPASRALLVQQLRQASRRCARRWRRTGGRRPATSR